MEADEEGLLPNPFGGAAPARAAATALPAAPNFPFFCPVMRHSIAEDIPQKHRRTVRFCFISALSFLFSLLFSFAAQFCAHRINSFLIVQWREALLALILLLFCPAALLYTQYFPLYRAARRDRGKRALLYVQLMVVLLCFVLVVGIPGSGAIGVGYLIVAWKYGTHTNRVLAAAATAWNALNLALQLRALVLMQPLAAA